MKIRNIVTGLLSLSLLLCVGQTSLAKDYKEASIQMVDMPIETALDLLLTNNNAIKAVTAEVTARKYEKRAAAGAFFPKIGINTSYFRFNDDITVGIPDVTLGSYSMSIDPLTLQDKNLWMAGIGATWNIFTGGKILALNSAAKAKLEATNEKYRAVANTLTVELIKRYYGLKLASDVVAVRKEVMETTGKHLDDAKKLEKEGIIAKNERLHADVAYRQAQREYINALKDYNIIEDGLKSLIKEDDVDLSSVRIVPTSNLFVYNKDLSNLAEFKKEAFNSNPSLKQLDAKKKIAQANYRSKAAEYSPTVSLFAYDIFASKNLSSQIPSFAFGAMANLTLFDGLSRFNNLKAAEYTKKQVMYEAMDAKNNIESLVTKNYNEFMKYKEIYESTDKSIEDAKEALRTANLAFKEGMGTSLAVIDAQTNLSSIQIQRLNAIYNTDVMLAELLATNGNASKITQYINDSEKECLK